MTASRLDSIGFDFGSELNGAEASKLASFSRLMCSDLLNLFVKAPRPGTVKTRLAQTIGANAAGAAYRTLVETLLAKLVSLDAVVLRFAPDDAAAEIGAWSRPGWSMQPQGTGDLGRRLEAAFRDGFAAGARSVVIIGSDCPDVSADDVRAAWAALESNDVVLGPARDGGYWLIGLREARGELLEGISWSTDAVLQETLQRARAAQLQVQLLRELTDVDTETEWREFLKSHGR